jgi:hypothetical protein
MRGSPPYPEIHYNICVCVFVLKNTEDFTKFSGSIYIDFGKILYNS